jgi:surface antigen
MKKLIIAMALIGLSTSSAQAADLVTKETCTGLDYSTYSCVSAYGYSGSDPYNLDRFSKNNLVDGTKHSCTSFAAFMLYKNNPYMEKISTFNAARSWAYEAKTLVGATVDNDPTAGDIAQWGKPTDEDLGHVAYVEQVLLNASGQVIGVIVADDNGGKRRTTSRKTIMKATPSNDISWPDNFITFPNYLGSGGGRPAAMLRGTLQVNP